MKNHFFLNRLILLTTLLFILSSSFAWAQSKVYASGQNYQVYGLCLLCSIENPTNAVGSNENDYATINIPVGIVARIEQTLNFPAPTFANFRKIDIGIGTDSSPLKLEQLKEVYIETFLGNTSNNDHKKVSGDMLKTSPGSTKGIIEFQPQKSFDRIKIKFNGGVLDLNDRLRVYYAYHKSAALDTCGDPLFDPIFHFPFNGNLNSITGVDLYFDLQPFINPPTFSDPVFQDGIICKEALVSSPTAKSGVLGMIPTNLYLNLLQHSKSISFWASTENTGSIFVYAVGFQVRISPTQTRAGALGESQGEQIHVDFAIVNNSPNQLNHYTITYDDDATVERFCLYKNGVKTSTLPNEIFCSTAPNITGVGSRIIDITLDKAYVDEFLVYDEALTADQAKALYCAYGNPQGCPPTSAVPSTTMKGVSEEEIFTVSPNPTTGQVNLGGNIFFADSDIIITNTSGKEVYRSKFISKTFDLPPTLPAGVYILNLQTKDKKIYSRKVILTR